MSVTREEVIDFLSNLTIIELNGLVKELETTWGVSAAAMAAPAAGGGGEVVVVEEQTEFDVVLTSFGSNKIGVIKTIRGITGLGLKEAKDLVEGVPSKVKEAIAKDEADKIVKELKEAGADAEMK